MITETQDASVASPNSTIPPNDKHYRLTGERPERKEKPEEKPEVADSAPVIESKPETDASATSREAVTSADSAPAQPQRKLDAAARLKQVLAEQKREREEWRQERERLSAPREVKQEAQPVTEKPKDVEPTIQDKDDKGQFKYKTLADFNAAVREYDRKRILADVEERTTKSAKEREAKQAEEAVNRKLGERIIEARKKHADFDDVALAPDLPIAKGSAVDLFTLDSEHGAEMLYELGKNPERLKEINAMHPLRQVRELTKMELEISKPSARPSAPPVTAAPRPPAQVSGNGSVAKDAVEEAVEKGDSETYQREMNARDPRMREVLARRKKG